MKQGLNNFIAASFLIFCGLEIYAQSPSPTPTASPSPGSTIPDADVYLGSGRDSEADYNGGVVIKTPENMAHVGKTSFTLEGFYVCHSGSGYAKDIPNAVFSLNPSSNASCGAANVTSITFTRGKYKASCACKSTASGNATIQVAMKCPLSDSTFEFYPMSQSITVSCD